MTKIVLALAGCVSIHAQFLSIGVKGGVPLNNPASLNSPYSNTTQDHWTGGPTVEVHLPFHFSVEFDALYRGAQSSTVLPYNVGSAASVLYTATQRTRAWDFPLLLKYRFQAGPVRPFLSAGYQFTEEYNHVLTANNCLGGEGACNTSMFVFTPTAGDRHFAINRQGPAAGAGVEFKARAVAIAPEVRFAHLTQPNTNQVSLLVGFSFGLGKK
jgi:hypothetical protein